ncbi:hypothetical protein BJ878DRAFT_523085 [Calycina marina]|uniref:Uncharacterized protein n=1 Tax=Calycina marina TaxID=1763456 RepID=A0A9P7YWD5_9HELO|nr:hypothetical protein BJ878DRAFT_523085 [Calycina marina]
MLERQGNITPHVNQFICTSSGFDFLRHISSCLDELCNKSTRLANLPLPIPMAPITSLTLRDPLLMNEAYCYSSTTLATTASISDDLSSPRTPHTPRTLYAQTFDNSNRLRTSRSLTPQRRPTYRKDISTLMTGFTTTDEEFDALPIVMRRKYFSTLERLRFAESSRTNALNELPIQRNQRSGHTTLADRRGLYVPPIFEPPRNAIPRKLRKVSKDHSIKSLSSKEVSWYLTLPEKIKRKQFTRDEQVILAGRLRESVILDAADEAILKSRRVSRNLSALSVVPSPTLSIPDWRSEEEPASGSPMDQSIYESFRWMEEEQDLDLKLVLDDYHANLEGAIIPSTESTRRPSFRRTMSINKTPFGRNSLSSIGPRSPKLEGYHGRNKSKALSMMVPKHTVQDLVSSIDPNATHYQDPEARLKLRVYLASPQKFDEAIEFGFPSIEGGPDDKENKAPRAPVHRTGKSHSTETGHSFLLNDIDTVSLFEDDVSMIELDSPVTPIDKEATYRTRHMVSTLSGNSFKASNGSSRPGISRSSTHKPHEAYTYAMAGSREMTLRMTLTRPDLRADENVIYGWQASNKPARESVVPQVLDEKVMRGPSSGADGRRTPEDKETGVVKRIWNRVKSQRKGSVQLKSG